MDETCEEVAGLLKASGGRAGVLGRPDLADHIGGCEACADLLVAIEEAAAAQTEAPAVPPTPSTPVSAAGAAPVPGAQEAGQATLPPLVPFPQAPAPPSPTTMATDWLPPALLPPRDESAGFHRVGGQRPSMMIRPVYFWLCNLLSATLGALVVLTVIVLSRPRGHESPSIHESAPALVDPGSATPDVQQSAGPSGRAGGRREGGTKSKMKGKLARDLQEQDVASAIKANLPTIASCIEAARLGNEITAGKHTMIFDFVILPSGAVRDAQFKGPDTLLRTSLPRCLSAKLNTWRFPDSSHGAPVTNVPITVTAN